MSVPEMSAREKIMRDALWRIFRESAEDTSAGGARHEAYMAYKISRNALKEVEDLDAAETAQPTPTPEASSPNTLDSCVSSADGEGEGELRSALQFARSELHRALLERGSTEGYRESFDRINDALRTPDRGCDPSPDSAPVSDTAMLARLLANRGISAKTLRITPTSAPSFWPGVRVKLDRLADDLAALDAGDDPAPVSSSRGRGEHVTLWRCPVCGKTHGEVTDAGERYCGATAECRDESRKGFVSKTTCERAEFVRVDDRVTLPEEPPEEAFRAAERDVAGLRRDVDFGTLNLAVQAAWRVARGCVDDQGDAERRVGSGEGGKAAGVGDGDPLEDLAPTRLFADVWIDCDTGTEHVDLYADEPPGSGGGSDYLTCEYVRVPPKPAEEATPNV